MDIDKEEVTSVPYNINGNHSYRIKVPNMKWHKHKKMAGGLSCTARLCGAATLYIKLANVLALLSA